MAVARRGTRRWLWRRLRRAWFRRGPRRGQESRGRSAPAERAARRTGGAGAPHDRRVGQHDHPHGRRWPHHASISRRQEDQGRVDRRRAPDEVGGREAGERDFRARSGQDSGNLRTGRRTQAAARDAGHRGPSAQGDGHPHIRCGPPVERSRARRAPMTCRLRALRAPRSLSPRACSSRSCRYLPWPRRWRWHHRRRARRIGGWL